MAEAVKAPCRECEAPMEVLNWQIAVEGFRCCEIEEGRLGDFGGLKPQYSAEGLDCRTKLECFVKRLNFKYIESQRNLGL